MVINETMTPDQIQSNWDELMDVVNNKFTGERKDNLLKLYNHFEQRMMFAPASGVTYYHSAFPGGYVCHVLNITRFALKLKDMYDDIGMHTSEYSEEDVIFCTLHHDLGKIGNMEYDYYIPNESEWHRINQGKLYDYNDKIHHMTVTDRSIWLLNQFNIKMSELEYLSLRLADGMYEDANKGYLMGYGEGKNLKSNLPYLIHEADMLATRWEKEQYMFGDNPGIPYDDILSGEVVSHKQSKPKKVSKSYAKPKQLNIKDDELNQRSKDLFNELFGDK
jgi:hypothetical protein